MTRVTLKDAGPTLPPLNIGRVPIYLRFTITNDDPKTLDCLNEEDDQAFKGEVIIPAKMDGRVGAMHVDGTRNGRRFGEWHKFATYKPIECPLTQEQLADKEAWGQWVDAEVAKEKEHATT